MSKPTEDLHPAYFETHFHHTESWSDVPDEFAIITAFATTGEQWSDTENAAADDTLRHNLEQRDVWLRRLTGYSPTSGHEEPGWAVAIDAATACEIGRQFRQDAIYIAKDGRLYVTLCHDVALVPVGLFMPRLHCSKMMSTSGTEPSS